ncbi:acyl carrier protein [Dehalobacterium formicoaceticum]|uniref:Phosphopantetheine-binding protein n=1 Tax=Dehalobacterium formicoaceticum TaxID=51515 RepID=A0ABT1XZW9_9FIRM|nr:phosphopantetheine-binding protein [Dehalobacterium formicoaceticum]MCR6544160.1 phosphopantetheine-binding protein [Dehalobacterium formicoaceticum]
MANLTPEIRQELREMIYEFFADECDVTVEELSDDKNIIDDLDGDSLLFVELIELMKKKYQLNVQLQTIGKYLLKNPAETVGQVIETAYLVFQFENDIVEAS